MNMIENPLGKAKSGFAINELVYSVHNNCEGMFLVYHPQINLESGKLIGAEALIRWRLNDRIISPLDFIEVAEKEGLIQAIGLWAIKEACKECMAWNRLRDEDNQLHISVNVSVMQLEKGLAEKIIAVLNELKFSRHLLDLEITESYLKTPEHMNVLDDLDKHGIKLSMDDFGTGYSCLANIQHLPFSTIKIDRSFIKDLHLGCESSLLIVEIVIWLAHRLGMNTLAEGIENAEQMRILQENGCHRFQGYLMSIPLDYTNMREYIANETWKQILLQK